MKNIKYGDPNCVVFSQRADNLSVSSKSFHQHTILKNAMRILRELTEQIYYSVSSFQRFH